MIKTDLKPIIKPKKPRGKPAIVVTEEKQQQVYQYGKEGLNLDIIADLMALDIHSAQKHFGKFHRQGYAEYKLYLKQQAKKCIDKLDTQLIMHQLKVHCGENDKNFEGNIQVFAVQLTAEQKSKVKAIKSQLKSSKPCVSNEL